MNEDDFIDDNEVLMTDVFWVQPTWKRDVLRFYNVIRRLKARYYKRNPAQGFYSPYSFLTQEQYFLFKLAGLDHRHLYLDKFEPDTTLRGLSLRINKHYRDNNYLWHGSNNFIRDLLKK